MMKKTFDYSETGLHLFYNPYSNCSQRIQLLLAEKGLTAEFHEVDLLGGAQLTDEYRKINPDCDVPAFVHEGNPMHDSITIMKYVEQTFPEPSFTPNSEQAQQEMQALLTLASKSHMATLVPFVYATGIGRLPTPSQKEYYDKYLPVRAKFHADRLAGKVANDPIQAKLKVDQDMIMLEQRLTEHTWLAGDTYSLADMAWIANVVTLQILGYQLPNLPNVHRWITAIENRHAFTIGIKAHFKPLPNWLIRFAARLVRKFGRRQ